MALILDDPLVALRGLRGVRGVAEVALGRVPIETLLHAVGAALGGGVICLVVLETMLGFLERALVRRRARRRIEVVAALLVGRPRVGLRHAHRALGVLHAGAEVRRGRRAVAPHRAAIVLGTLANLVPPSRIR